VLTEVMKETTAPAPTIVAMGTMWICSADKSDYGIDRHDKSSTKWLVFGARGSLECTTPELISKRTGQPKVELLHGLSDALTRYLNNRKAKK
jgi:hypothetical protein